MKNNSNNYLDLQKKINYQFKNKRYLLLALTHSSYQNEQKDSQSNERLEFLGDAVLELCISDYIYNKFTNNDEGELSKIRAAVVCEGSLSKAARKLDLGEYLHISRGEEQTGGRLRDSILSDAFESVIGAIYLDGGMEPAKNFILQSLETTALAMRTGYRYSDPKTSLQEIVQKNPQDTLDYKLISQSGPAHDKTFVIAVILDNKLLAEGTGKSKKEAEQNAAAKAIEILDV